MPSQCVTGVIAQSYHQSEKSASEFDAIVAQTEQFLADNGRRPRILIAKMGQDGHDRGAKVIASAYSDLGFDVDLSPMFSTPEEIARLAVENDVRGRGWRHSAAGLRLPARARRGGDLWSRYTYARQCARRTESDKPAS